MSQDPPKSPNLSKDYEKEIQIYLQYLPQLLAGEQDARMQYDPQRIAEQQALQSIFGPTQYNQQLDALHQLDPTGTALREQLGAEVSSDLGAGYGLPPDLEAQLNNQIRGAQVAHGGSTEGAAPITAEALFKGQNAINLRDQRLNNAGQFLGLATPEQQLLAVQPVSPDRSSAYVDPTAGFQGQALGQANFQNQLAQYQVAGGSNPWTSALSGAASGAAAGSAAGGWGALAGGVLGGVGGYFGSDAQLKENIEQIGKLPSGIPLVRFNYRGTIKKAIGVLAQHVIRVVPDAVSFGLFRGKLFAMVDYKKAEAPFLSYA